MAAPHIPGTSSTSLARKTVRGAIWAWIARAGYYGLTLISISVLARMLPASAYGLMGMVTVVTGFLAICRDLGTAMAIVRQKDLTGAFLSTMFWANAALGLAAAGATAALAPAAAALYREPRIEPVMMALSVNFALSGATSVYSALLNRQMAFRRITQIELLSSAASVSAAIVLAKSGAGVWSLVAGSITLTFINSLLLAATASWHPRLCFSWPELKSAVSFSLNLSGSNSVNYFLRKADFFLIGRYLGAGPLAHYQFAYTLMLFPLENITWALGRVFYPAFATMQDDDERLRRAYLRVTALIGLATFPLMLGMLATAGPFVRVLLGPAWTGVVPILAILVPIGMLQSIGATVGQIYLAKGRADIQLRWTLLAALVILPCVAAGLRWGAAGVAMGYAVASAILVYPQFAMAFRLIRLPFRDFLSSLWPCLRAALAMLAVAVLVRLALDRAGAPPWATLSGTALAGAAVYAALVIRSAAPAALDALQLIGGLPGGRIAASFAARLTKNRPAA